MTDSAIELDQLKALPSVTALVDQLWPLLRTAYGTRYSSTREQVLDHLAICILALERGAGRGGEVAMGPGFVVVKSIGLDGYSVAVLAADLSQMSLDLEWERLRQSGCRVNGHDLPRPAQQALDTSQTCSRCGTVRHVDSDGRTTFTYGKRP